MSYCAKKYGSVCKTSFSQAEFSFESDGTLRLGECFGKTHRSKRR